MPQRQAERRGLRLWHVWIVLPLAFVTAIAIAAGVFFAGWDLLGARELKPERRIDSKTLFDLVELSFGVVAGAGALVALIVAYRRQRVDEDGALREATRLHTERFTTAVSQLGDDSAAVRLGGVHALAGLADDAPTRELRQTCIDVLCAYLRLPYTAESDLPPDDADARHAYLSLREVRHTIIRLIRDHLRLSPRDPRSWQGHDFDFTSVVFDGGDFTAAEFTGGTVSFNGAHFTGGTVDFVGARFAGATVNFTFAEFAGGTVNFTFAEFTGGTVDFSKVGFTGGTVNFTQAKFAGGTVDFTATRFIGGSVEFIAATFADSVNFYAAEFHGATVSFRKAEVTGGTVDFNMVRFVAGRVEFRQAEIGGGRVDFTKVGFLSSTVDFTKVGFHGGTVDFSEAEFRGGTVDFSEAEFRGGTVDLSRASGATPAGLPSSGMPWPATWAEPAAHLD
ncbi:pentapeptide repeat-containing protein [Streptomyces sp. NPDC052092]|uniref:pentapeptide repeat-containing protein n=1 Tax=Streptomyces sp. NPDC052092 TaxID=3365685 RepID=UPI0037CE4E8B